MAHSEKGSMRIDRAIASQSTDSRKDVHKLLSKGRVTVNGETVRAFDYKVNPDSDVIAVAGQELRLRTHIYIMLNKPQGVICSTKDELSQVVIDLLPEELRRKKLFPAGRLDKDTEGFVLITDDGEFAHRILSPRKHVPKTYIAVVDKPVSEELIEKFEQGVMLGEIKCAPACLKILENGNASKVEVIISQGMYHQIKRMFLAFGLQVLYLKRTKIGGLCLDESLQYGESREILTNELQKILMC